MDIRLDKETFKALASETRVDVLKLLGQRRYMQTEIASILGLSTPTVKEHLDALEKAGLVERHEEGRKWKYYSLTKKGRGVLNPEEMKIWIVLALLVFSVAGGLWTYLKSFMGGAPAEAQMMARTMDAQAESLSMMAEAPPLPAAEAVNHWPAVFTIAAVVFAVVLIYLLLRVVQYKRHLGKSLSKK
jgi:DNA-binding transcriptional ArsR family regulator